MLGRSSPGQSRAGGGDAQEPVFQCMRWQSVRMSPSVWSLLGHGRMLSWCQPRCSWAGSFRAKGVSGAPGPKDGLEWGSSSV